jgi:hypothetical protein
VRQKEKAPGGTNVSRGSVFTTLGDSDAPTLADPQRKHCHPKATAPACFRPLSRRVQLKTGLISASKTAGKSLSGRRAAIIFMDDLASQLANRVQLTSDGHKAYLEAVEGAFGGDIDYAMLVKLYGPSSELVKGRYSPAECIGARKAPIEGNPDPKHISTSYAERSNLSVRMHTRRFHSAHECLLKEGREPRAFGRAVRDVLQFRSHS